MRQETVGKHVLHADSVYLVWRTKVFHVRLKVTGAKTTFTNDSDAGPLQCCEHLKLKYADLCTNLRLTILPMIAVLILDLQYYLPMLMY